MVLSPVHRRALGRRPVGREKQLRKLRKRGGRAAASGARQPVARIQPLHVVGAVPHTLNGIEVAKAVAAAAIPNADARPNLRVRVGYIKPWAQYRRCRFDEMDANLQWLYYK